MKNPMGCPPPAARKQSGQIPLMKLRWGRRAAASRHPGGMSLPFQVNMMEPGLVQLLAPVLPPMAHARSLAADDLPRPNPVALVVINGRF